MFCNQGYNVDMESTPKWLNGFDLSDLDKKDEITVRSYVKYLASRHYPHDLNFMGVLKHADRIGDPVARAWVMGLVRRIPTTVDFWLEYWTPPAGWKRPAKTAKPTPRDLSKSRRGRQARRVSV